MKFWRSGVWLLSCIVIASCAPPVTVNNQVTQVNQANQATPGVVRATAPTPARPANNLAVVALKRAAPSGVKQQVDTLASLNPDCSPLGIPIVTVKTPPSHGELVSESGEYFTNFPKENQRYECNLKKSRGTRVYYLSGSGYRGSDAVVVDVVYPDGITRTVQYNIVVE